MKRITNSHTRHARIETSTPRARDATSMPSSASRTDHDADPCPAFGGSR